MIPQDSRRWPACFPGAAEAFWAGAASNRVARQISLVFLHFEKLSYPVEEGGEVPEVVGLVDQVS